jgi:hypothetical protein
MVTSGKSRLWRIECNRIGSNRKDRKRPQIPSRQFITRSAEVEVLGREQHLITHFLRFRVQITALLERLSLAILRVLQQILAESVHGPEIRRVRVACGVVHVRDSQSTRRLWGRPCRAKAA